MLKCPSCKSANVQQERRVNGNATCSDCRKTGLAIHFQVKEPEKIKPLEAIKTFYCSKCHSPTTHLELKEQPIDDGIERAECAICSSINNIDLTKTTGSNDGSKNSFYAIPDSVKDLDDLAEYLELDPNEFNVLKTLWVNKGIRHNGTTPEREVKKRIHYSQRSLVKLEKNK